VLPIQMFNWLSRPDHAFHVNAAATGAIIIMVTLLMNGTAIWLRYRIRKNIKW
jgi:phosphate transport system permease protein